MIKFKTKLSSLENLYTATQYRVQDYGDIELDSKKLDSSVSNYLKRSQQLFNIPLESGAPMSSALWREYLRDLRFLIVFTNLEINSLEAAIQELAKYNLKKIKSIQRELNILESEIIEEEYKFYKDYEWVHHNNFSKRRDRSSSEYNKWNYDYKTGLSIGDENYAEVYPFAGLTLPVLESTVIPITKCLIIHEETDVGDTLQPLVKSNPNNCILDNEVFRYAIIRKEYDETGRLYNHTDSYLTLSLEFDNIQVVNYLEITPAGANTLELYLITYINEAGEEIALGSEVIEVPSGLRVFTEAVRAKNLKLKFRQITPVNKQSLKINELNNELNSVLEGLTWTTRFDSKPITTIEGRVYDFSIKTISVLLNRYNNVGYYSSEPRRVNSIATARISSTLEQIPVSVAQNFSEATYDYLVGSTTPEFYLSVTSKKRKNLLFEGLIPLQDSFPIQKELIPISGGYAKFKLYPNLTYNLPKIRVVSIEEQSTFRYLITTVTPHELSVGESFFMIGPVGKDVTDDFEVLSVIDSFTIQIKTDTSLDLELDEETKPNTYLYLSSNLPNIVVKKGDTELSIGTDFQITFGNGVYYSTWDYSAYLEWLIRGPRAGEFGIKILNPTYTEGYYAEYRPLKNQWLDYNNMVKLQHGAAVFDSRFKKSHSEIQTIVLLRSSIQNYYTTSILTSYTLGVNRY